MCILFSTFDKSSSRRSQQNLKAALLITARTLNMAYEQNTKSKANNSRIFMWDFHLTCQIDVDNASGRIKMKAIKVIKTSVFITLYNSSLRSQYPLYTLEQFGSRLLKHNYPSS